MTTPNDLFQALNVASQEVPDVGLFLVGLGGRWQHVCHVDFPFQEDVEIVFVMNMAASELPPSMPANVIWVQENLVEIWNTAAQAVNELVTTHEIELDGDFEVESLEVQLPNEQLPAATWRLTLEPVGLHAAFEIVFRGMSVIGKRFE